MKNLLVSRCLVIWISILFMAGKAACGAETKAWTVLIYMAGQNNLSSACVEDVLEMMEVGSTDQVNIIVQADISSKYTPTISDKYTYRFKVLKNNVEFFPLESNLDMASPDTLTQFIQWGVANFPASRYALILWDHGLGWLGGVEDTRGGDEKGILSDEGSGGFMSLEGLRGALQAAGTRFDLIELDACLMAQVEVLGYIGDYADYITFSENTEPGDGNPYDVLLNGLVNDPSMGGDVLGRLIVDSYVDYYSRPPNNLTSVTKALVKTSGVGNMLRLVDAFGKELSNTLSSSLQELLSAREATQSFVSMKGACDLIDFIDQLELRSIYLEEAQSLRSFLRDDVILYERHYSSSFFMGPGVSSGSVDRATGLAINLPLPDELTQKDIDEYASISGALGLSHWKGFIDDFLEKVHGLTPESTRGGFALKAYWTTSYGDASDADLDLYIVEPEDVFAPWMGLTTPNGFFSPDSKDSGMNYEIYVTRDEIKKGIYIPVINFYDSTYGLGQRVWCYLLYFPSSASGEYTLYGPQVMGLWNPAPMVWDDYVIYLLSMNFYSDWWIPTYFERLLSRASIQVQRRFWLEVRRQMEKRR